MKLTFILFILNFLTMFWTFIFFFLTLVTAILGFLGLGFGPIESAKIFFYILAAFSVISFIIERRNITKHY